ncbi:MAG: PAS domain-containing protein [Chloroflexales bacterium]|nr:PAS domain-containing protein [Chloroflexales bacterium]
MHEDASRPSAPEVARAPFPIVGLGASAGGLAALQQFFAAMPPTNGMAFVVIMHLSPEHDSHAAALLQRSTAMPVRPVTEPVRVTPETVYVIPPTRHLVIDDGMLVLTDVEQPEGRRVAIDLFFRTLADTHTTHAACIVLSGTGADGSVGIMRVKEAGGIIIAQDPQEAEYDAMPRHAISTGVIDFVLPAAAMPAQLLAVWQNAERIALPAGGATPVVDARQAAEEALRDVLATVRTQTGHDCTPYKRPTVLRRIERRMQVTTTPDLPAYRDYLQAHPTEAALLLQDLLISVTNFFRDRAAFDILERAVVPLLFTDKTVSDAVRVWVAGCASGEEAYSIVMLLLEYAARLARPPDIQVFATDIDEVALQSARAGSYPEAIAADVSPARLRQFFTYKPGGYRIAGEVRDRVVFATHNLLTDPPFSRLDLVSCRNLLIYLNRAAQARAFDLFRFALRPGGFLFLGHGEAPADTGDQFTVIDKPQHLFRASASAPTAWIPPFVSLQPSRIQLRARMGHPDERSQIAFGDLHHQLLERHLPASLVVNAAHEIVHLSEHARPFVQVEDGVLSFNLLHMVRPELRGELRMALVQAFHTGQPTESLPVQIVHDGRPATIIMHVHPERDPATEAWFALVLFDALATARGADGAPMVVAALEPKARQLEADVQRLREQLDLAIAEHATAVAALRASNEELHSSNEELRATAEELETNKEELQSVNEELRTVNQELNQRVDELSATNDDLSNLMAATAIAIVFLDRGLRITRFTPHARTLFNLIHSDEGRPLAHITHRLDYDELLADAEVVLRTAQPIEREVASGATQYYLARIAPYRSTGDRTEGIVLTFVDITERRQAEAALARAYAAEQVARIDAEEALQTRDQFLSIASHELRTPMTSLIGYAQLLRKAWLRGSGDLAKMTDRIVRQALQLDGLIDQLLDVSRLQRGQFVIEPQPVDIAALSAQVMAEFRDTLPPDAVPRVTLAHPDNPVLVMGDPARLDQVLLNLLSNAVKYSPPGGAVQVRVAQTATEAVLEVVDQGIGIPAYVHGQLFMPFFRAPNVGAQTSGFGLGLYIVREIVQRHGGRVEVASVEGTGSVFRVVLPLIGTDEAWAQEVGATSS